MEVFRKPATADWYDESAKAVATIEFQSQPWTEIVEVTFDGTKDKSGERHTSLKLRISESDVERAYGGLMEGRNAKLKEQARELHELRLSVDKIFKELKLHLERLDSLCAEPGIEAADSSRLGTLRETFRAAIEKCLMACGNFPIQTLQWPRF